MFGERVSRTAYLLCAALAWFALALQLWLLVQVQAREGHGFAFASWRFLGFFTVLANLAVALVSTAVVLGGRKGLASPRVRFAAAAAILIVGVVYTVALRSLWTPQGWQAVADGILHDAVPILFTLAWVFGARGPLGWKDLPWVLVGPAAYLVYALARGHFDGWYAYWFLNPTSQAPIAFALSLVVLLASFLGAGVILLIAHKLLPGRAKDPIGPPPAPAA